MNRLTKRTGVSSLAAMFCLVVIGCGGTPAPEPVAEIETPGGLQPEQNIDSTEPRDLVVENSELEALVAEDEARREAERVRTAATPATSFGDGSHEVGVDIAPGTYRTSGPGADFPLCSYARLRTAGASVVLSVS